jgi:hypothetical protein
MQLCSFLEHFFEHFLEHFPEMNDIRIILSMLSSRIITKGPFKSNLNLQTQTVWLARAPRGGTLRCATLRSIAPCSDSAPEAAPAWSPAILDSDMADGR